MLRISANDQRISLKIEEAILNENPDNQRVRTSENEKGKNLENLIIKNPSSTFYVRIKGNNLQLPGVSDGDLLVVDRKEEPGKNSMVVAIINGEMVLKRVGKHQNKLYLFSDNAEKPVEITDTMDFTIWGVVNFIIHKV
jgi:DNA polymerase V